MKLRSYLKSFLILCFLPVLFVHAGTTNAAPFSCGGWSVIPSANPGTPDGLTAVAAVSATDVWAVGGSGSQRGSGQPVIEQWNGTQWNAVSPRAPPRFTASFTVWQQSRPITSGRWDG